MKNPFKHKPTEEEKEKIAKQKKFADKMRELCNFYFERDGFRPEYLEEDANVCSLGTGFNVRTSCSGEDCIFMKILKQKAKS